jgi:hypothetical protein
MRTVPYFQVWKGVVNRHGLDPDGDKIPYYTARAINRAINRRVRIAWRAWDWPDFSVTEERPYRTIWNATRQFYRSGANGQPDQLFFLPNVTYYQVNPAASQDPPVGTPPVIPPANTNPSLDPTSQPYFILLQPLDPFVSMDQVCQRSIGRVIGIYKTNPRLDAFKHSGISFRITENGIDLFQISGPTIFVKYLPAPSKFTTLTWIANKIYNQGDLVFWSPSGECYASIINNNSGSTLNLLNWRLMPMPEVLAGYVEAGAYADCMRESHPVDKDLAQMAMQQSVAAEAEAKELLQSEIDILEAEGQRHSYQQHRPPRRWIRNGLVQTPSWTPGTVTTLTDACQFDGMFAPPVPQPGVTWEFHPEIVGLIDPPPPSLQGLPTVNRLITSVVEIVIPVPPSNTAVRQTWQLFGGVYDGTDPGQVLPRDYNPVSNIKVWHRVG